MLYLENPRTIEWTTVFRDHADPGLYYYLPNHLSLGRTRDDQTQKDRAVFQIIKYAGNSEEDSGGFVNFEVRLETPPDLINKIKDQIPRLFLKEWKDERKDIPGKISLQVAPWDDGTVRCMALDLEGSGGTLPTVETSQDNHMPSVKLKFVEGIRGATKPSLDATNTAIFGLQASEKGVQMIEKSFTDNLTPIGVLYELQYTGMLPSFEAHIKADMSNIYSQLSLQAEAQVEFIKGGIAAGIEKMRKEGKVKIDITDYTGKKNGNKKLEKFVYKLLEEKIISEWMEPVLTPGEFKGGTSETPDLAKVAKLYKKLKKAKE